jgi:hypothetical protein
MSGFDKKPSIGGEPMRAGWNELLESELSNILASGHFDKSPTLQRLLIYLVSETIRGGEKLKSYVVAVDGLGKDPQFDSHTDSYPRVQVMRLRKMLEGYYARRRPLQDMCIHVPAGSYEVKLARPAMAYPEIFDRLATTGSGETTNAARTPHVRAPGPISFRPHDSVLREPTLPEMSAERTGSPRTRLWVVSLISILFIAIIGYMAAMGEAAGDKDAVAAPSVTAPMLILERPVAAANSHSQNIANEAYAKLADSLTRSWAVRLSLTETAASSQAASASYHLAIQVGEPRENGQIVYLRLTEGQNAELIWSTSIPLDPEKTLADNLGKSVAQLAGPFGVIATRETAKADGDYSRGYTCLLGYMEYLNAKKSELLAPLSTCLSQPIGTKRLDAVRLALQSFHIVTTADTTNQSRAMARARGVAQQSIQTDPNEAYAHFAMARVQYVTDDCAKGVLHTKHAAQANPYDPVLLAVLGNFASHCGDPAGEKLLERAFDFRSPGESYARLSLILSAIRSGQLERLPALSSENENVPGINAAYHHLCETLVAAATGKIATAKNEWKQFAAASGVPAGRPDTMMQDIVLSPQIRRKIIAYLRAKGVLPEQK